MGLLFCRFKIRRIIEKNKNILHLICSSKSFTFWRFCKKLITIIFPKVSCLNKFESTFDIFIAIVEFLNSTKFIESLRDSFLIFVNDKQLERKMIFACDRTCETASKLESMRRHCEGELLEIRKNSITE